MSPAVASLLALLLTIAVSCTSRINVGLLAIALTWGVGLYSGQADLVTSGFPSSLFLTLAGVTALFALAEANGTVDRLARAALSVARGRASVVAALFFVIACAVSTAGPGAIASVALVAPMAMAVGGRAGIPPFLTALMVANGANAGNLSAVSVVGVIANTKMAEAGLRGHELKVWAANFLAHVLVGLLAYLALGGPKLPRAVEGAEDGAPSRTGLSGAQWLTASLVTAWIVGVVVFRLPPGPSAFGAAVVLVLARAADEATALKRLPWAVILMVTGMSVLIAALEKTGGLELFTALLARLASPASVNGVMALVTGLISTYSSTSGVVLPTFLPAVPSLLAKIGGGDALAVSLSINVGASLVDVSPLSTLGALCLAALPDRDDAPELFRRLLIWGLSMSVVGAALCQMFAGPFARL